LGQCFQLQSCGKINFEQRTTKVLAVCVQLLQECFEKKDIAMLQDAVTKMPKEDAEYHIKRCIDSGLWVPGGGGGADKGDDDDAADAGGVQAEPDDDTADDNVYSHVDH